MTALSDRPPAIGLARAHLPHRDAGRQHCAGTADALRRLPIHVDGQIDLPLLAYAAAKGLCKWQVHATALGCEAMVGTPTPMSYTGAGRRPVGFPQKE